MSYVYRFLTYKALIGNVPSYLKELVVPYCPTRELRPLNAQLLVVPSSVQEADTSTSFKRKLKTFLYDCAYSSGRQPVDRPVDLGDVPCRSPK